MSLVDKVKQQLDKVTGDQKRLFIAVTVLLFLLSFITYYISTSISGVRNEAFLLNVSAGFFGSGFTFAVLGYFESQRDKNNEISLKTRYLVSLTNTLNEEATNDEALNRLLDRAKNLLDRIDKKNLSKSRDILEFHKQIVDYALDQFERGINHSDYQLLLSRELLSKGVASNDEWIISNMKEIIEKITKRQQSLAQVYDRYLATRPQVEEVIRKLDDFLDRPEA